MRLINADKLIETIKAHDYLLFDSINSHDYGMFTVGIEQAIAEQPALDTDLKVDDAAVVDRKAVVALIRQALEDSWKDYDPRLGSFAEGLIEKIRKMDSPFNESYRAAQEAHLEKPRIFPVEPIKLNPDVETANYIDHLIDDMMEKWRENGGKLNIVFTYGGKEIE
jgi:hypothetical protein